MEPFITALINFGALGLWVLWMVYRDKRDSERREKEQEIFSANQKEIAKSYRACITTIMVAMSAFKSVDATYVELIKKIEGESDENTIG